MSLQVIDGFKWSNHETQNIWCKYRAITAQNLIYDTLDCSEGNRIRFHVNLFGLFPSQSDNFTQIPETLSAGDGIIENLCKKNLELGL